MRRPNIWTVLLAVVVIVGALAIIAAARGDGAQLATIWQGVRDLGPGLVVVVAFLLWFGVV
jgi:hypothetical protein